MTLHTFQGQSAGPVDDGQPLNSVDRIIVEPGTRSFEGNNPGTMYMAASRATTMGTGQLDSAIYFTGPNMNKARILNMKYKKNNNHKDKMYKKVALREKWVARLEQNTIRPKYSDDYINNIKRWCHEFRMDKKQLDTALANKAWRTSMRRATNY
jgi:hypothetical protein